MNFFIGWLAIMVGFLTGLFHSELGDLGVCFGMVLAGALTQIGRER